jgi:membrane protein DedA with SNARE-associated domain
MVSLHIQLLLGLVLYFTSENVVFKAGWMKVDKFRFYGMEHILMMVIAIVLVTIGRKKAEKQSVPAKKFKTIALWYTIALLIIIAAIPWPFREALGGKWF